MFNFWEAFTYIFKEKDWQYKFLLPFALQLLIVVPGMLMGSTQSVQTNYNLNSFGMMSVSSPAGVFGIFYACLFLISFIPYLVVNIWYFYENTQAGIFKRDTKAIWKNDLHNTLKKAGKYLLTNLLYGFITFLIVTIVLGFACVVLSALGILIAAIVNSGNVQGNLTTFLTSGLGILLICFLSILFVIFYAIIYIWMTTGQLRLIATNTFEEGIKFGENWKLAMKYKWKFLKLFFVVFIGAFIIGGFAALISITSVLITASVPLLSFIMQLLFQIGLALVVTYLGFFVYPRLLGQVFRSIVKEEPSLKFIKL